MRDSRTRRKRIRSWGRPRRTAGAARRTSLQARRAAHARRSEDFRRLSMSNFRGDGACINYGAKRVHVGKLSWTWKYRRRLPAPKPLSERWRHGRDEGGGRRVGAGGRGGKWTATVCEGGAHTAELKPLEADADGGQLLAEPDLALTKGLARGAVHPAEDLGLAECLLESGERRLHASHKIACAAEIDRTLTPRFSVGEAIVGAQTPALIGAPGGDDCALFGQ